MNTASPQTTRRWAIDPDQAFGVQALRERLIGRVFVPGLWGWIVPLAVTVLAGMLRFTNLNHPHLLIFDETYYVKDAYTMMHAGYELEWGENPNDAFINGHPEPKDTASFVVHPPLGKWLIAGGMWLFGTDNGLGWRFSAALFGTLSVLLVALVAQKLFSSVLLGGLAGGLAAIDGHQIVMSRTGLLDIFLMFFILAGFWALLNDRFHGREKLARALATVDGRLPDPRLLAYGPWILWRPWRLLAGVMLGCAAGVKWSALSFIAVFGLMTVLWDLSARRRAGIRHWIIGGVVREGIPAFLTIIPTALRRVPGDLDRVACHGGRPLPAVGGGEPVGHLGLGPGLAALAGRVPPRRLRLPPGPGLPARLGVLPVELAFRRPPRALLLRVAQQRRVRLHGCQLRPGHHRPAQPDHVVGRDAEPAVAALLLDRRPRLARRGDPRRRSPQGSCRGSPTPNAPCSSSTRCPLRRSWCWR